MNLYQKSGYVNIKGIIDQQLPFNFVVGGRGTGKTYTALSCALDSGRKWMLMRRQQSQCDLINKQEFSPLAPICKDRNITIISKPVTKYNAGFYMASSVDTDGNPVPEGSPIGYTCALSTISNLRGFDASEVELLIYDEFIPEPHAKPIKGEGQAFLNAYETINRNRELQGRKPLQVLCLANSNNLGNPIFLELNLVNKASQMQDKGKQLYIDKSRGIGLFMLDNSPISKAKADTALYRLTAGSEYAAMALDNAFMSDLIGSVKHIPLTECKPWVSIGSITIYVHKSNRYYYVSEHLSGSPDTYGIGSIDKKRFKLKYSYLWEDYMEKLVVFESKNAEILFVNAFE